MKIFICFESASHFIRHREIAHQPPHLICVDLATWLDRRTQPNVVFVSSGNPKSRVSKFIQFLHLQALFWRFKLTAFGRLNHTFPSHDYFSNFHSLIWLVLNYLIPSIWQPVFSVVPSRLHAMSLMSILDFPNRMKIWNFYDMDFTRCWKIVKNLKFHFAGFDLQSTSLSSLWRLDFSWLFSHCIKFLLA